MELKVMLYNCYYTVCHDSCKYLDSHSRFSCYPERLNFKMLLDSFKEQFYSPAVFIKKSNLHSLYLQVVCQVDKGPVQIDCIVYNSAKFFRVFLSCVVSYQLYNLVRKYAIFIMSGIKFFNDFVLKVSSLTYNKVCFDFSNMIKPLQIKYPRSNT